MANNIHSHNITLNANTGDYIEIAPYDDRRTTMLIHAEEGQPALRLYIGLNQPTDDTDAVHMKAGSQIEFTFSAPIGPIWARSDTAATSQVSLIHD